MVRSTNIAMLRLLFASIVISVPLLAQGPGNYSISGVVVNSQTGEPVKYALVTLVSFPVFDANQTAEQPMQPPDFKKKAALAGETGEFIFHGLAKSHYTISAQKPGFAVGLAGGDYPNNQINLTDNVTGKRLRLSPLGVIEGKVVDQDDEPLRGVQILAMQLQVNDGLREARTARSVATDDRGVYRLWDLQPGRYYLKAAGKSGGTYSSWQSFAPVYAGNARTIDSAKPVTIEPGTNATADFHLTLETAFRIRGTVQNPPSGAVSFELVQGAEHVTASRSTLNASTGRFEIQDVTPGAYLLRVEERGKLRGEVPVMVSDSDVNDVTVSLSPPVTMKEVTRVIGAPIKQKQLPGFSRAQSMAGQEAVTAEEIEQFDNQPVDVNCSVSLRQPYSSISSSPRIRRDSIQADQEKETFTIGDVFPGVYGVQVNCEGGYATAVLSGGMDLLTTPLLSIQPGVEPPPIEVQAKPGGGTLTVDLPASAPADSIGILTVPAFNSTGPRMYPAGQGFLPQENNGLTIPFLAPGDYAVYALKNWQNVEFRNPAFLQTLAGGVSVHVEDGKEQHISLKQAIK